jgi:hypothetical protein
MRKSGRVAFERRAIPRPEASVIFRRLGAAAPPGAAGDRWELQCRDGWDWRSSGPGLVFVRVATFSPDQAPVVQGWVDRIKSPSIWWAVSRELQLPESAPEIAQALRTAPWLAEVFPVLLEASVDGVPPRPAALAP